MTLKVTNLKAVTITAFGALLVMIIGLYFAGQHTGTPTHTTTSAPAFSRKLGEVFQCSHGFMATLTPNDAERAGELIKAGDKKALTVMALQGRFIAIKKGTTVTIEDRDIWKGTESFRVQGDPDTRYATIGEVR